MAHLSSATRSPRLITAKNTFRVQRGRNTATLHVFSKLQPTPSPSGRPAPAPAKPLSTSSWLLSASRQSEQWLLEDVGVVRDIFKEDARKIDRSELNNFTWDRWASHRSGSRYFRHMLGIFQSNIIRGLAHPLLSTAGVATVICMYEDLLKEGVFPEYFSSFIMPQAPFDLTSFALALLLVFRTNTSYDRWLEVSTVWSGLANRARDTMRQVISHLSDSTGAISPLAAAMCRWVVAYSRSLKAELVEGCDLEAELAEVLTPEESTQLLAAHHRPSFALSVLTELGAAAPLRESHRIRLDENLTYFEDAVGTCERILRTPIPLSYTRHTSRFMVIWLSALPLGLYSSCGWATIPLAVVIGFLLLGIDEIGVQIEEPFGLLPLDEMCAEIENDLFAILKEATVTKKTAATAVAAAFGQLSVESIGGDGSGLVVAAPYSPLPPSAKLGGWDGARWSTSGREELPASSLGGNTASAAAAAASAAATSKTEI